MQLMAGDNIGESPGREGVAACDAAPHERVMREMSEEQYCAAPDRFKLIDELAQRYSCQRGCFDPIGRPRHFGNSSPSAQL